MHIIYLTAPFLSTIALKKCNIEFKIVTKFEKLTVVENSDGQMACRTLMWLEGLPILLNLLNY